METYISLLRGINVSGKNKINMADLKALYESMGFLQVQTYLQSGNVVFQTQNAQNEVLGKSIEAKIAQQMELNITVIIRNGFDIMEILERNPFLTSSSDEVMDKLYVTFLSEEPNEVAVSKLKDTQSGLDTFIQFGKEIYVFCPTGYGRTKLTTNFFETKLNLKATSRSWRTVSALKQRV